MNYYFDTSFLVSFYLHDANAFRAIAWMEKEAVALPLTSFGEVELTTAIFCSVFRRNISPEQGETAMLKVKEDLQSGLFYRVALPAEKHYEKALALSRQFTAKLGCRSLDVLHVAAALVMEAEVFLTFDKRQKRLARTAGLKVGP